MILLKQTSEMIQLGQTSRPPNELDIRRIKRMLADRVRYRYVSVNVIAESGGYHVTSPCCSRAVSSDGSMIDIARIEFDSLLNKWKLFSKDHENNAWELRYTSGRFTPLMDFLNKDPEKIFWQ